MGIRASSFRAGNNRIYRSSLEAQIAILLDKKGIRFFYEHPVAVLDEGKLRIWYPDFQLVDYGIFIEYFGVEGNPDYSEGIRKKKEVYEANGLSVIILTPDSFKGKWPERIMHSIGEILTRRLDGFCGGDS